MKFYYFKLPVIAATHCSICVCERAAKILGFVVSWSKIVIIEAEGIISHAANIVFSSHYCTCLNLLAYLHCVL